MMTATVRRALIATALLVAGAPAVMAHAFLKSATPTVGSTVYGAPSEVTITFTEGVEPAFSTIEVRNASGQRVDAGSVTAVGPAQLAAKLTAAPPGPYKVIWHATSVDTHKTEGAFTFTVTP